MTDDHFDQLSPVEGVHQVQPDGTIESLAEASYIPDVDQPVQSREEIRIPDQPIEVQPPALPPMEVQLSIAQQVEDQRIQLARQAGNTFKGAPHFMRVVNGAEVCGQCAQPFPCDSYLAILDEQSVSQQTGADGALVPPTMAEAAAAAGLPLDVFMERLRASRGA